MKAIDMHCDTIGALYGRQKRGECVSLQDPSLQVNLDKLAEGDYMLQNFALFVYLGDGCDPYKEAMGMADLYDRLLMENNDRIAPVLTYADIEKNAAQGKLSAMLTVEEGAVCQGSLQKLQDFYDRGVRMMTLTWNFVNEIGWPNTAMPLDPKQRSQFVPDGRPQTKNGLTEFGKELVKHMEKMGMIVDVSHLSDAGFYDVYENTQKPFVASHSNARAVCGHIRNLTDDMLRKFGERGCVTGLNYCPAFMKDFPEGQLPQTMIDAVVDHARHIVNVAGIDCLGLGSDFDGIGPHPQLAGPHHMPAVERALKQAGFTANELEKMFYQNVLRVYREVLK